MQEAKHMRTKWAVFWKSFFQASFLLFFLAPCSVDAAETVRLVTGDDYKPFTDQTLPQGGMITEIVDHVFQAMGHQAEIEYLSWNRGYRLSEEGVFLGAFPYVKTPERLEAFYFSDPIYTITTRFFVRQDSPISFDRDSDLKGLSVCKPLGYNLTDIQPFLDQNLIDMQRPSTMESCFGMLRLGRVDLVPINEHVGWQMARQVVGQDAVFRVLEKPLQQDGLHLIVTKKNPQGRDILGRFNAILRQMRDDGRLDAIIRRHLPSG